MADRIVTRVPTEPEVKSLLEAFPEIEVGRVIPYAEVEQVIRTRRGSSRWSTVTGAWRRRLCTERNFILAVVAGEGFKRLSESDRSFLDTRGALDKFGGALRRVEDLRRVDITGFDAETLRTHTHRTEVFTRLAENVHGAAREIVPPKPTQTLPRLKVIPG